MAEDFFALQKKDGGIRPSAVGCMQRRLAAKCANKYALNKISREFSPIHVGVGTPGDAEVAILTTQHYMAGVPEGHIMVKSTSPML